MITSFDEILDRVESEPIRQVAVAAAGQPEVLESVKQAQQRGIATGLLVGDQDEIERIADEIDMELDGIGIIDAPDDLSAAHLATQAVHEHRADLLMKGYIHTDDFLRAVLDKETGLRTTSIMSHAFLLEASEPARLLIVTDGAMNIAPDLEMKAAIMMNAVYLAHLLGNPRPNVGVVAAIELVNPKMSATLDAAALGAMARRGQFPECTVDGPFAMDNAISVAAAEIKAIPGEVAGRCDILLVPDIEAGNILVKTFSFLCGGKSAGVLIGAQAPVVLTSRADSAQARLRSIALGVMMHNMQRHSRLKIGRVHF